MANKVLDLEAINIRANYIRDTAPPYYPELQEAMRVISLTGCRIDEAFDISRWEHVADYEFNLQPQKGNNLRAVTLDNTCDNFRTCVINQTNPFLNRTPRMLYNVYNKIRTWGAFKTKGSYVTFYIFRYRFIKQLHEDGLNVAQLSDLLGYTNYSTVQSYLDAEIEEVKKKVVIGEIKIGDQIWADKNLDVDDGEGGIYAYVNSEANVATWGRLYTWDAAVRVAANIDGWHLPTDAEWTTLTTYLGETSVAGGKLKETGTTHWNSPNIGATNEYGFTALPGGRRNSNGAFNNIGYNGYWWSATENNAAYAWYRNMNYSGSNVFRYGNSKEFGFSVRLIKDAVQMF